MYHFYYTIGRQTLLTLFLAKCFRVFLVFQFVLFTRSYSSTPTVLIAANHSTKVSGNSAPIHNGISTWIEVKIALV